VGLLILYAPRTLAQVSFGCSFGTLSREQTASMHNIDERFGVPPRAQVRYSPEQIGEDH